MKNIKKLKIFKSIDNSDNIPNYEFNGNTFGSIKNSLWLFIVLNKTSITRLKILICSAQCVLFSVYLNLFLLSFIFNLFTSFERICFCFYLSIHFCYFLFKSSSKPSSPRAFLLERSLFIFTLKIDNIITLSFSSFPCFSAPTLLVSSPSRTYSFCILCVDKFLEEKVFTRVSCCGFDSNRVQYIELLHEKIQPTTLN